MKENIKSLIEKVRTDYEYGVLAWEVCLMIGLLIAYIERYLLPGPAVYALSKTVMVLSMIGLTYQVFFRRNK